MDDTASEPAPKLQKSTDGDVTAAPSPQAMQGVTPDQPQENKAAGGDTGSPLRTTTSKLQMEGGKKRKVALYISYIGAGYHVSAVTCLTGCTMYEMSVSTCKQA